MDHHAASREAVYGMGCEVSCAWISSQLIGPDGAGVGTLARSLGREGRPHPRASDGRQVPAGHAAHVIPCQGRTGGREGPQDRSQPAGHAEHSPATSGR
jgi:hypothetical protein